MKNTCNYSDDWQPYIGDYDKFEYDIKLSEGIIIENCYPNDGQFHSYHPEYDNQSFDENQVVEIRFSQNPVIGINDEVSNIVYKMSESMFNAVNIPIINDYIDYLPQRKPLKGTLVEVRTEPKIGRNELCKCGSGKKFKKCCINQINNG